MAVPQSQFAPLKDNVNTDPSNWQHDEMNLETKKPGFFSGFHGFLASR
jgi:hypothetical protein